MSKKLLAEQDLMLAREEGNRGVWMPPVERKLVYDLTGDGGVNLYSYYLTQPFKEASELQDSEVADDIGWNEKKVQRYRLALIKAGLLRIIVGTGTPKVTHLVVGADRVALCDAGLPYNIINKKAFSSLKKELRINDTQDLIKEIPNIINIYNSDPGRYK